MLRMVKFDKTAEQIKWGASDDRFVHHLAMYEIMTKTFRGNGLFREVTFGELAFGETTYREPTRKSSTFCAFLVTAFGGIEFGIMSFGVMG